MGVIYARRYRASGTSSAWSGRTSSAREGVRTIGGTAAAVARSSNFTHTHTQKKPSSKSQSVTLGGKLLTG